MAVALEDLRRRWRRLEAEPLTGESLELGACRGVRTDRAGELADAHPFERARDALAAAGELERPARELQPERRRLGMDAVRAADLQHLAVFLRSCFDGCERAVEPGQDQRAGLTDLHRQRRVDDVGGREAVVEPAARLAELLGGGIHECCGVVVEGCFELRHPLRGRRGCAGDPGSRVARDDPGNPPIVARPRSARPRRPWQRAPPPATWPASPRPTRSWPWPGGSNGRSRSQSRAPARWRSGCVNAVRDPRKTRLLWRGFTPRNL